jgi:hypothetical protein
MLNRYKRLFLVSVIVLIPVLLGTTPLNLFHKLSGHGPFSEEKQIQRASSCLFYSAVSQDHIDLPSLNLTLPAEESTPLFHFKLENSTHTKFLARSSPLRF